MNNNIPIIGQKICDICGKRSHTLGTRCQYNDLVERVRKLLEANTTIPALLQANSEAIKSAQEFQFIAKTSSGALEILERIVKGAEGGDKMWTAYMEAIELWANQTSNPGTSDQPETSSQESTTPNGTPSKLSIAPTQPGGNIALDS